VVNALDSGGEKLSLKLEPGWYVLVIENGKQNSKTMLIVK
jgi:hypothetical protein